ncbi:tyrosine-type recombinase/integrase [Streptomyces sp. NPDC017979]|uniref:tyrosine-type recombinase/integrase n=1 Tax=Streptomyces sp. NPDC017979 TaxID=3365024 RepID=UPI003793D6DD
MNATSPVSSIMRAAVDDDVIAVSPCRSIDLPAIATTPPQWFPLDQAQSVLDELPAAWRTMCLLGFYTGLRWGELTGLHHHHRIDRRCSRLFVVEVNTKSGIKEYPKSSKSQREVPLPPHVAFPPVSVELPWGRPEGQEKKLPLLLTTRFGIAVAVNTWNTWTWKSALARAGVIPPRAEGAKPWQWAASPKGGFHVLRHSYASMVLAAGECEVTPARALLADGYDSLLCPLHAGGREEVGMRVSTGFWGVRGCRWKLCRFSPGLRRRILPAVGRSVLPRIGRELPRIAWGNADRGHSDPLRHALA